MNGGNGKNVPDEAPEKMGVALENRHEEPGVSVEATSEPADENTTDPNGIRVRSWWRRQKGMQPGSKIPRLSRCSAIVGTASAGAFPHCRNRGIIRIRHDHIRRQGQGA